MELLIFTATFSPLKNVLCSLWDFCFDKYCFLQYIVSKLLIFFPETFSHASLKAKLFVVICWSCCIRPFLIMLYVIISDHFIIRQLLIILYLKTTNHIVFDHYWSCFVWPLLIMLYLIISDHVIFDNCWSYKLQYLNSTDHFVSTDHVLYGKS